MKQLALTLFLAIFCLPLIGQELDSELGFIYVKGEYLMGTERYEDAIVELNKVIKKNVSYKDALLLRAEAKYSLGAYLGTRKDILLWIDNNGVSPKASQLLGLAEYQLENYIAAENSLVMAAAFISDDERVFESLAEIYYLNDDLSSACDTWSEASALGSSLARKQKRKYCSGVASSTKTSRPTVKKPTKTVNGKSRSQGSEIASTEDDPVEYDDDEIEEILEEEKVDEVDLESVNEMYIDEDLTLELRDGLGAREILKQPNILILSDDSGDVTINLCVSKSGRVDSAEFNKDLSTLQTKSIISLALRKAKDFWFEKSRTKVCGTIAFKVTGRQ